MGAFERKTNQYLNCARQLLKLCSGDTAHAAFIGAVLAFERSVLCYLLERISPHAGKRFEPLEFSSLAKALAYCQQHREHVSCGELAALYTQQGSWLAGLAAHHARSFTAEAAELNRAFFESDQFANDDQTAADADLMIVRAADSDTRLDARQLEIWLDEFVSLVQRQRLESDEY